MVKIKKNLSLYRPATYQIKVPGHLDEGWTDWADGLKIRVEKDVDGVPITTLNITIDQAGLIGLLRRLYSLGLPLISVNCVEV